MSNEWNLKGKTKGVQIPLKIGTVMSIKYNYMYSEEDIEILRQKLIEDLNEISVPWRGTGKIENQKMKSIFKRIINKRFGVEK